MTTAMALTASPAFALPGDPGVNDLSPYRLNARTLEPGCFQGERGLPQNLSDHIDIGLLDAGTIGEDLHVSVDDDADASVDQVLVADMVGYKIYNTFDTGTVNSDADVDPGQTATGMNGFTAQGTTSTFDTIVCVSDHGTGDNEPYAQEAGGMVSAKNRPILTPKVTAFGVSAIANLHTYRIGFGYDTTQWYTAPTFDGHSAFATVTDPNAFSSPTFDGDLPAFVSLFPRPDGDYDTRRVNDVDKPGEEWSFFNLTPFDGQSFLFGERGDLTAWADDPVTRSDKRNLITDMTQGDFPISWTLRPSLAAPSSKRKVTWTLADYFAWNKSWQDYYKGGKLPALPLAPGTNSPAPDPSITVVVNPPLTQPAPTPANPTPPPVAVAPVAAAPVAAGQVAAAPVVAKPITTAPAAKKVVTAKQKKAFAKCVKTANKKQGKTRTKARAKCAKMPH
ncbi:hypothetical protein [Solirubrobacter ginsenosidimutans]|nr:hypothetical protein [Solirubrobacter ginsenosidimutans]